MVFALVVLIFNGKPASTRAERLAVMMKSKLEAVEDRSLVPPSMPNLPTYLPAPPDGLRRRHRQLKMIMESS
nr:hypothetical protein CFP56_47842 [Quercus suber]